jgi:hypothetical protein
VLGGGSGDFTINMTDRYPQPKLDKLIDRLSLLIGTATSTLEGDPAR